MLLSELPVELLLDQVLPWLTLQSLAALTCTNKFFAVLCSDDTFWKLKLQRDYNFSLNADTARESGWKIIYRGIRKPAVYTWGAAGQGRLGLAAIPKSSLGVGGVPVPTKVDLDARVVSLVAGGWCFNALDDLGQIYVWGQLDGEDYALNSDGFSERGKCAKTPHRLDVSYPVTANLTRELRFSAISCGRSHSVALDQDRYVWIFRTWGRPVLYDPPVLTSARFDSDNAIVQVEAGWTFVSMLTKGGDTYVVYPFNWEDAFHAEYARQMGVLDRTGGDHAKARATQINGKPVIPCHPVHMSNVPPLVLPPIPTDLPDLGDVDPTVDDMPQTKLVRIGAGDNFIIGLTNRGHVLSIDLTRVADEGMEAAKAAWSLKRAPGWVYLPEFSDVAAVGKHRTFSPPEGQAVSAKLVPPTRMRTSHISAHFNSFVAYSVSAHTAPYSSLVLVGRKEMIPSTNPLEPNETLTFPLTIHIELLDQSIISLKLGDYHSAALSSDGKLRTWGQFSDGALGLGDPANITAGAPGGYATEADRLRATGGGWGHPPDVQKPQEVHFDVGSDQGRRKFVVSVAASGWHTGALVIDLDPSEERASSSTAPRLPDEDEAEAQRQWREWNPNPGNRRMPGDWPYPQPSVGSSNGGAAAPYQHPPFNPIPDAATDAPRTGPPYPLPTRPFETSDPNAPIMPTLGPLAHIRVGFAGRGATRGGGYGMGRGLGPATGGGSGPATSE